MGIGETLVREGVVSAHALAHAEGVQRRGFGESPVTDLLVDLEYVDEEAMAVVLSELAKAPRWDDEGFGRGRLVRRVGPRLHYATANPFDEAERNALMAETQVRESIPLVATRSQIATARICRVNRFSDSMVSPQATSEREMRLEWSKPDIVDDDFIQGVNSWLLMTCSAPGRVLRAQAFEQPMASVGTMRRATPIYGSADRRFVEAAIYRIAFMACASTGPGLRAGRFRFYTPRLDVFDVLVASTPRGEALWCQRVTPAFGVEGIAGTEAGKLRKAFEATDDGAQRERIARAVLERTHDEELLLDRVWALTVLAELLDASEREAESRVFTEQGLALVAEHGLAGRLDAGFRYLLGANEIGDAGHRAKLFADARRARCAPGVARGHGLHERSEELAARFVAGEWEECLGLVDPILKTEQLVFGAKTVFGITALADTARALSALGRVDEARSMVSRIDMGLSPRDAWLAEHARGAVASAAGQHREAIEHFRRAFELPDAGLVVVAAAWARALVALGRTNEAIAIARGVEDAPVGWSTQREAAELERIRRMAPYR